MIKLFIYEKKSGVMVGEYLGEPALTISDIPDNQDFTLKPPPNTYEKWYWYDNEWQSEPKPTAE